MKMTIGMPGRARPLCSQRTTGDRTFPQNAGIFNQYTAHEPKRPPPINLTQAWKSKKFPLCVTHKFLGFLKLNKNQPDAHLF
jgi:hypothetical protein